MDLSNSQTKVSFSQLTFSGVQQSNHADEGPCHPWESYQDGLVSFQVNGGHANGRSEGLRALPRRHRRSPALAALPQVLAEPFPHQR
jgi:hypothetical protein